MTHIIGVCGGSASGKTTLAKKLSRELGDSVNVLALDNYYKNFGGILEELSKVNYDHPNSLDIAFFTDHIKELKKGKSINVPVYDYATHSRLQNTTKIKAEKYIIVEGLFLYNVGIPLDLFDMKIFIDTPSDIRFIRRLIRDQEERARSVESIVNQYLATVRPMHDDFVSPNKKLADIVFKGQNYSKSDLEKLARKVVGADKH